MILKETKDWLVLNKPSGLHSLRSKTSREKSLEDWIIEFFPNQRDLPDSGIVHRLDELTSGCLLVAKNRKAYDELRELMKSSEMKKTYFAVVEGKCPGGDFEFYFSSRYKRSAKVTVKRSGKLGEYGHCKWVPRAFGKGFTLLEVSLLGPGKRHQIRAGLARLGHPICGDLLYGGSVWTDGFGLHAYRLQWHRNLIETPPNWSSVKLGAG